MTTSPVPYTKTPLGRPKGTHTSFIDTTVPRHTVGATLRGHTSDVTFSSALRASVPYYFPGVTHRQSPRRTGFYRQTPLLLDPEPPSHLLLFLAPTARDSSVRRYERNTKKPRSSAASMMSYEILPQTQMAGGRLVGPRRGVRSGGSRGKCETWRFFAC